jgi:hypothetical protein
MTGVHLGVKGGCTSGVRYGYSQIANPYYLWRKGTTRAGGALSQMVRNVLVNIMKSIKPEPWIDRRGRAFGNTNAIVTIIIMKNIALATAVWINPRP